MEQNLKKILIVVLLVCIAVLSATILADHFSKPDTYSDIIASIDSKVETVMKLTGTSTAASAGLSALPSDTGTPIAGKLADFAEYFLVILCVLYTEKYLLTIIGTITFRWLVPIGCLLLIISLFTHAKTFRRIAVKVFAVAATLVLIIPLSIRLSDAIYITYQDSIDYTIASAEELSDESLALSDAGEDRNALSSILQGLSQTAGNIIDKGVDIVNRYVETLAVLIVTSCIIPLLVIVFFVWLLKVITGVDLKELFPQRKASRHPSVPDT
ncbi:MAG: hypothetical protein IJQ02_07940 [Oscillospiraceae bacterium]|nr:hypothetical protein [Oscillospiraceae bacterium]MBR0392830.1 hypothetical protein [Oscillospiraceae bacterium]